MTDIYNRSLFERNSVQTLPAGKIDGDANTLFKFLGSFWTGIHKGRKLVSNLQKTKAMQLGQFYLDMLETLNLQSRRGAPVFHRDMWKPLPIRLSRRNKAQGNVLKVGGSMVIGPQEEGSIYGEGKTLTIGTLTGLEDYVSYPVDADMVTIASSIVDNVVNPKIEFSVGQEFPDESHDCVYADGTLIFPKDKDPFAEGSGFEAYDIPEFITDDDGNVIGPDREIVLWASDVLIDKDFINEHMAYALGISCESTEIAKRILNAGWDAINCGLTPELLRCLLAAMLNIPVVQEELEQVREVSTAEDGTKTVTTDFHKYTVYSKSQLRECIKVGARLSRGDMLDQSVRIYPFITDVSRLEATTEYADILKEDVPVITIPRTILRTETANGLAVDWNPVQVLDSGKVDSHNHRKLFFDITGSEKDVDAFWNDVWDHADRENIDLDELFEECSYRDPDSDDWYIVPAEFFLRHMIGANTLIVTIDRSQLDDVSKLRDPRFFGLLSRALPSGTRLFFVERSSCEDSYTADSDADSECEVYAHAGNIGDVIDYSYLPGMNGHRGSTYEEEVEMKFIRSRKHSAE